MSCSIEYITSSYTGEVADTLASAHWGIFDTLQKGGGLTKTGSVKRGSEELVNSNVEKLNQLYRPYIGVEWEVASIVEGKLALSVTPIAPFLLQNYEPVLSTKPLDEAFYFGTSDPLMGAEDTSNEGVDETATVFRDAVLKLKQKLAVYKDILRDNPGQAVYNRRVKIIEEVLANTDEMQAVTGFIHLSNDQLVAAKAKFDSIKDRYSDVTTLSAGEIKDFATQLVEIQNFLNFYDSLKDIKSVMDRSGVNFQWDIIRRIAELFEEKYGIDVPIELQEALTDFDVTDDKARYKLATALYNTGDTELRKKVEARINSTTNDPDHRTGKQSLIQGLDTMDKLKGEFDTYYTNITTAWLFPHTDALNAGLDSKAKAYESQADELQQKADAESDSSVKRKMEKKITVLRKQAEDKRKGIVDKGEFTSLIKFARKDLGFFTKWMGAPISMEDPLTASIATALKDGMYRAKGDTDNDLYELMDLYQQQHAGKDLLEAQKAYLRKAIVTGEDDEGNTTTSEHTAYHEEFEHDRYWHNYTIERKRIVKEAEDIRETYRLEIMRAVNRTTLSLEEEARIDERVEKWKASQMRAWHEENTVLRPDWKELLETKKANLTKEEFRNWLADNTRQQENTIFESSYGTSTLKDFLTDKGNVLPDEYAELIAGDIRPGYFLIMSREFNRPAESYRNEAFTQLQLNDPYFRKLYDVYKTSNDQLPRNRRLSYGIIQQLEKDLSFKDNWLRGTPQEMLMSAKSKIIKKWNIDAKDPEFEKDVLQADGTMKKEKVTKQVQHLDGTPVRNIPIRYTALVPDDTLVDKNLLATIGAFAYASNTYREMSKVQAQVDIVKTLIKGNAAIDVTGREVADLGLDGEPMATWIEKGVKRFAKKEKDLKINDLLDEFLNDVVYGEEEYVSNTKLFGKNISLNKLGSNLGFITSLYTMAGNIQAGIGNLTIGNVTTFTEGVGGKFWTVRDNLAAHKDYMKTLGSGAFFKDLLVTGDNWAKKSMITQMLMKYDAIQGEFLTPEGKIVGGSIANQLLSSNTLFFNQNATEHQIQSIGMLSALRGFKLSDGTSLWDAQGVDAKGKLVIRDEFKSLVTPEVEMQFMRRLHGINKQHHGNYNKFDKSSLQRQWYGRMALMFRKYLYTSFKARLGKRQVDYELGDTTEGYHRLSAETFWGFGKKLIADWKEFGLSQAMENVVPLTDDQIYARNKTIAEMAWMMTAMLLVALTSAWDPDEDKDKLAYWANNEIKLQANRLKMDLIQFVMPFGISAIMKVITSPAVALNVIQKILDVMLLLFSRDAFDTYQRDTGFAKKGESKLKIKFLKLLPLYKQYITLMTPADQAKFYDLVSSGGNPGAK